MANRVVVFGSGGQLGIELVRTFEQRGYEVHAFDRKQVDICDGVAVERAVAGLDPKLVLNAAAYNQVDLAESDANAAFQGNALAVRNIAKACRNTDCQLIHFSTDYVFDGTAGRPYVETDQTHPLGAYAVSKLSGELYAQAYLANPLVIRTSGVFGPGGLHTARGNFVELMLRLAAEKKPIRVVEDHIASPTYAPELAVRSADLYEKKLGGVFHVGGGTAISWYDYAKLIFEIFELSPELHATDERQYRTAARRPKFSALSNGKMESAGVAPMPPLRVALERYRAARQAMQASA